MIVPMMKKNKNIEKKWLLLFEFISKLLNSYYLIVDEEAMGKNIVDDIK